MEHAVAIVGGGPAGLSTALFLAHAAPALAERIVVLEKKRYPRDKYCAGGIGARADTLLATIGVTVDVPSVAFDGMTISCAGTKVTRRPGAIGRVVRRIEFDAALAEAARARGVRIVEGAAVTGFTARTDGVEIASDAGVFRAEALVGADGVGSVVRKGLGLPPGDLRAQVVEVDTEAVDGDVARDLIHFDLSDRSFTGYAWDFPTVVGGEPLVCRGIYQIRRETPGHAPAGDTDVSAVLDARLRAQGLDPLRYRKKRFAERGIELHRPFSAPRVLLVGESAGIDPVTGEGIAQAIEYGATAGAFLARKLAAHDYGFGDWRRAVLASHVGVDLRIRSAMLDFAYWRARPFFEGWMAYAPEMLDGPMEWFAGRRVPRWPVVRSALKVVPYALGRLFTPA